MNKGPITTLVVLGSSLTALAVARDAATLGLRCVMIDDREGPACRSRRAAFSLLSDSSGRGLLAALDSVTASDQTAVIADSDRWLRGLLNWGDSLRQAGFLVLHPHAEDLAICLDKTNFLQWCHANCLPAPRVYDSTAVADLKQVRFPLLLRPEQTQHSSTTGLPKAVQVNSTRELAHWLTQYSKCGVTPNISESLLGRRLRQYSIGASRNLSGQTQTFSAEKVRPDALRCAGGTFVRPVTAPAIERLAVRALDELRFFGIAEVEVLHDTDSGESFLIEINARPWLQYSLPAACGCDLLGHTLGITSVASRNLRTQPSWLYWWPDVRLCFSRTDGLIRSGGLTLGGYLRSLLGPKVYPLWDLHDPGPIVAAARATVLRRLKRLRSPVHDH